MKKNALFLSIVAIIILASCSSTGRTKEEATFQVISPLLKDTVFTNEYVADITALQNVELRARIKGYIEVVLVDEGQTVHKGQTLFSISKLGYKHNLLKAEAALSSVRADLKSAEIELENVQKLLDKKIVAPVEVEMQKSKVAAEKAQVAEAQSDEAQARLKLSYTEVKAPFDGVINRIPHRTGSLVEEGTLLTTISNNKEVYAYFNVSEKDYLDYAAAKNNGTSKDVALVLANGILYHYKGRIETTESEFDKSTGNIAFRAKFPNPDNLLKHGASGKVLVKTVLKNATLIPQKSTFDVQENIYVFVVDSDEKVHQRRVVLTARLPHLYVIQPTLSPEEKIVYEGTQKLRDGDEIIPEEISFPQSTVPQTIRK